MMSTRRIDEAHYVAARTIFMAVLLFSCGRDLPLTPVDPSYRGDYRLEIGRGSLPSTVEVFRQYRVPFTGGRDTFWRFESVELDTGQLHASYRIGDSLTLYFIVPSDTVRIVCVRPNGRRDTVVLVVSVINVWLVSGPGSAAAGDTVCYRIVRSGVGLPDPVFRAVWNGTDTLSAGAVYSFKAVTARQVGATLVDGFGHALRLSPVQLTIVSTGRPEVMRVDFPDTIRQGDTLTLGVLVTGGTGAFRAVVTGGAHLLNDTSMVYKAGISVGVRSVREVADTGLVQFGVVAIDTGTQLRSEKVTATWRVVYTLPRVFFGDSIVIVPLNTPVVISVGGEAARYHWTSASLGLDTLTIGNGIAVTLRGAVSETLYVCGVNRWGYEGPCSRCVLSGRSYRYTVEMVDGSGGGGQAKRWAYFCGVLRDVSGEAVGGSSFLWTVTPVPDSQRTRGDTLWVYFGDSVTATVRLRGIRGGDTSNEISRMFVVRRYSPFLVFSQGVYGGSINVPVTVSVIAGDSNVDGSIAAIKYRLRVSSGDTVHTLGGSVRLWEMTFSHPDTYTVESWAVDNDGFSSATATAVVVVSAGRPYFTLGDQSHSVYIMDTTVFRVLAQSGAAGVSVSGYVWKRGGEVLQSGPSDSFAVSYAASQVDTIRVWAVNGRGDTSAAPAVIVVRVKAGAPVVEVVRPDSLATFINRGLRVWIRGRDENGVITKVEVDDGRVRSFLWGRDTLDTVITVVFSGSGRKVVRVCLTDEDGVTSGWVVSDTIVVDQGVPVVTGVAPDTAVWVFDRVRITVLARDNGSIASCSLSVDGAVWRGYGSVEIDTTFTTSGVKPLYVKVRDDDGNVSAVYRDSITVRLGAPVIREVKLDTSRENVFVRDERRYTVTVADTHGQPRVVYVNWDGGATAQDSVYVNFGMNLGQVGFRRVWDTSRSGLQCVNFWAVDNDGLMSEVWRDTITVRLGAPVVYGDSKDTIFLIVDRGYGDYYYKPKYADTNGVIDTFYFGQQENIALASKGKVDSAVFNIDETRVNKGATRYIWVKDDDGLIGGGRFVVFADSAPPRPTIFQNATSGDSIILRWEKKQDYKDGMNTRVQVLTCYGTGCTPTDSLFPSNALPTLTEIESRWGTGTIGGTPASVVKFKKPEGQPTGVGRWRVILVDERGTATIGPNPAGDPATFEVP